MFVSKRKIFVTVKQFPLNSLGNILWILKNRKKNPKKKIADDFDWDDDKMFEITSWYVQTV